MTADSDNQATFIEAQCMCGKRFLVPLHHRGHLLSCKTCGATIIAPTADAPFSATDSSDEGKFPAQPDGSLTETESVFHPSPPPKRPFWKDPILLIGGSIPLAILIGFFTYLHVQPTREHVREEIIRVKQQGDSYLARKNVLRAYERYDALLRWVGTSDPGDNQSRLALD